MERVDVTNVHTQSSANPSGLILQSAACGSSVCGNFTFVNSTVKYLNNGVEYNQDITLSPFLYSMSLHTVEIRNISLHHNFVAEGFENVVTASSSSLLYLKDFYHLSIESCEFRDNVVSGGLIVVSSSINLPKSTEVGKSEAYMYQRPHIVFWNLTFSHNIGAYSLIFVKFTGDTLNIDMARLNITDSGLLSKSVISLSSEAAVTQAVLNGANKVVFNPTTGLQETVWIAHRHCSLSELSISGVRSYENLLYIRNLGNVVLEKIDLISNDGLGLEALTALYQHFESDPGVNATTSPQLPLPAVCAYSLWLDQSVNVAVSSLRVEDNRCPVDSCGLVVGGNTGTTSIINYLSQSNACSSQDGLALLAQDCFIVTIRNLTVANNVNAEGGMVVFGMRTAIDIADSNFEDNSGRLSALVHMRASQSLIARRVTFSNNQASASTGGAFCWTLSNLNTVRIDIQNCAFVQNAATRGGAIALEANNATTADMQIRGCNFSHNSAKLSGSAIYVGGFIDFTTLSAIQFNDFIAHTSLSGVVYLIYSSGSLLISDCTFFNNVGSIASVLFIETDSEALTTFTNCQFYENHQAPIFLKSNSRTNSTFATSNCKFRDNEHSSIVMEGGLWRDFNTSFEGSRESELVLSASSIADLESSRFLHNSETTSGGAAHLLTGSHLICVDCVFHNNSAGFNGGALYVEQNSFVALTGCVFTNNSASSGGGVLSILSSTGPVSTIESSVIEWNYGGQFGVVLIQSAAMVMDNVTVRQNTADNNPGITLLMTSLWVRNSNFSSMKGIDATFLSMYTNSYALIENSVFSDGECERAGLIELSSTSNLTVSQSSFLRLSGNGVIVALSGSSVSLGQVSMLDVRAPLAGSLLSLSSSTLYVQGSSFFNFSVGGIEAKTMVKVAIRESIFAQGEGHEGAAASFLQCQEVIIEYSTFYQLKAKFFGGALFFDSLEETELKPVLINSCTFVECSSEDGGAIVARNHHIEFRSSSFRINTAQRAGAIFLDCQFPSMCNYTLSDCHFANNSAAVQGGALAWTSTKPTLIGNSFQDNHAPYGNDLASYAIRLTVELAGSRLMMSLSGTPPGQRAPYTIVASLRDHYGQIVVIDNSSLGVVESEQAAILGSSKVTAVNGQFIFDNLIVYGTPNSTIEVSISSTAIVENAPGDPDPHEPKSPLTLEMRDCVPGEVRADESCTVCSAGTYSFDPSVPCQTCSQNANCLGGYVVVPNRGYWRSGKFSAKLFECPNLDACLGGDASSNLTGVCADGYRGNMCQSCADNYSRTGKNKCDKCPPPEQNVSKLICISLAMLVAIVAIVSSTMRSATRPLATHSIMFRIFVNYLQLVLLVTDFKLKWPKLVLSLFVAQESVGGVTEQAFSIDCFLANGKAEADAYYRKMIMIAILPIPLILAAILFWIIVALRKKSFLLIWRECLATIVILFFLVLPNIVKAMFSLLSCTEIEDREYWLTADMSIQCWDRKHNLYAFAVAAPAILIWVVGVPLLCLGMLIRYSTRLDELWMKLQYGFLINGYRRHCYYWEFVIFYRKILIICCSVFLNYSIPIQALSVQLVMILALLLQIKTMPYTADQLNFVEIGAITVANTTIYCGLYYLTDEISEGASLFMFIVILMLNILFTAYWLFNLLKQFMIIASFKYSIIGRVLRPGQFVDPFIEEFIGTYLPRNTVDFSKVTLIDCYRMELGQTVSGCTIKWKARAVPMRHNSYTSLWASLNLEDYSIP